MAKNVASLPFVYKHVALMPDVHLGKGALVGSVIATKDAVIPAAVGVDIGCFTGDTLIPLVDGKSYPIRALAEQKSQIYIYSCTATGKIVAANAIARLTRHQASLVKVVLDNGEEIRCTPDRDILHTPSQCDRRWLLPPAASFTKLHTGSAGFKHFIVSKMPNATTTAKTMDLISILYVLLLHFQRWLAGDLTGFIPMGRSSPVVGGNTPILTLSNAVCAKQGAYLLYHRFYLFLNPGGLTLVQLWVKAINLSALICVNLRINIVSD